MEWTSRNFEEHGTKWDRSFCHRRVQGGDIIELNLFSSIVCFACLHHVSALVMAGIGPKNWWENMEWNEICFLTAVLCFFALIAWNWFIDSQGNPMNMAHMGSQWTNTKLSNSVICDCYLSTLYRSCFDFKFPVSLSKPQTQFSMIFKSAVMIS